VSTPASNIGSIDLRLDALRASDGILAALQATFALPNLIDGDNPFRFVPEDPAQSKLWVCDPESKLVFDRGGSRAMILVERLDYTPLNLHLLNSAGGNLSAESVYSDLGSTVVIVTCEGGNKYQSEQLGSIVYQVIKRFRLDLMREFSLHSITPIAVSRCTQVEQAQGSPWVTTVQIKVETQERFTITEIANQLNALTIRSVYNSNLSRQTTILTSTDSSTVTLDE
jgi:hypothetical protein